MADESWIEVLDGAMAAREPRPTRRSIAVNYPPELYPLVMEASKGRGMSMQAFQRRAALAFAQYDLRFDWALEMANEPPVGSFVRPGKPLASAGRGFGLWLIDGLRDA